MQPECLICAKHRHEGPLVGPMVFEDDVVVVSHRPPSPETGLAVPGYLFVETPRHAADLAALNEHEVVAVSQAAWTAAKALRAELSPDFVFSAIAGRTVPHFHQHIFVRPHGTPDSVPWNDVDSWEDGPRYDANMLARLCIELRSHFPSDLSRP